MDMLRTHPQSSWGEPSNLTHFSFHQTKCFEDKGHAAKMPEDEAE